MFFAETQNKLLFAITNQTAAEIIISRANAQKPNMGLTAWNGSVARKQDIITAKNYLTNDEIDSLNRLTTIFLEIAELRAKNRQEIKMSFWKENVNTIIQSNDFKLLQDVGSISNKEMEERVRQVYADFDQRRKKYEAEQADLYDLKELKELENKIKNRE